MARRVVARGGSDYIMMGDGVNFAFYPHAHYLLSSHFI